MLIEEYNFDSINQFCQILIEIKSYLYSIFLI